MQNAWSAKSGDAKCSSWSGYSVETPNSRRKFPSASVRTPVLFWVYNFGMRQYPVADRRSKTGCPLARSAAIAWGISKSKGSPPNCGGGSNGGPSELRRDHSA